MEQILIYHSNGTSEPINDHSTVSVIKQAEHKKALLGQDIITMTVESATTRNFGIGDYIRILGLTKYKINQLPTVTKNSERKYQYELIFEGPQYDLSRASYRNTDIDFINTASDFSLIGDMEMFLNVLINNLNRIFVPNKFALGTFPSGTETKNLTFNGENCLTVLQRLCEEYKQEFVFTETSTQTILHVKNLGAALDYSFKYGQGKGLYRLTRENVDTRNMVNTVYSYGSSKNLPADYKNSSPRLRIGGDYDLPTVESTSVTAFGIFEGSVIFEEIYPNRTGVVTGINASKREEFSDTTMDFDLNEKIGDKSTYLIPGNKAKVVFQSGNLAGYEFEISKYDHSSKIFTLNQNKDPKGTSMPSDKDDQTAFHINIGDTYVIVDIMMPQSYINVAEDKLLQKTFDYLDSYSYPTLKYSLELDEGFIKSTASTLNVFEVGDTVNILDDALAINSRIKIAEFTRDILRPYKYSLVIQDSPTTNVMRIFRAHNIIHGDAVPNLKDDPVRRKTDWRSDTQMIAEIPEYIQNTPMLEVGKKSGQVKVGMAGGLIEVLGDMGIRNESGYLTSFRLGLLTEDREVSFPDQNIVVNDWQYIVGIPEAFPSLTSDYGLIGVQDGINRVFQTSAAFVAGSTIVSVNGVRQFRGASSDYVESGPDQITFALAPYADDNLVVDFQKQ